MDQAVGEEALTTLEPAGWKREQKRGMRVEAAEGHGLGTVEVSTPERKAGASTREADRASDRKAG